MKIVDSADWRDRLAYEAPYPVAEVLPGDPARCAVCTADIAPYDRAELWAVKHRHPKNHGGFVRFYCAAHLPARPVAPPPAPVRAAAARRPAARPAARASEPRVPRSTAPLPSDVVRAMCPDCYVEVSATGECGMCGARI